MRLNLYLARCGIASRRQAEHLISAGLVKINDSPALFPFLNVKEEDRVTINGAPVTLPCANAPALMWKYYKLPGYVTTHDDPQERPTVKEHLRSQLPHLDHLITVGRLDMYSEGLLLVTTDGRIARLLELPSTGIARRYHVKLKGDIDPHHLKTLDKGCTVDGIIYRSARVTILERFSQGAWTQWDLTEGKNREIRRLASYFQWEVQRLVRVQYGPWTLEDMGPGSVKAIPSEQVTSFLDNYPEAP